MDLLILALSLCLQLLAAALAIALIPITRTIMAWVLVAAALVLMTGRRAITLAAVVSERREADLSAELVALVISIAMVVGVALIRPVFTRMRDLTNDLADREQKLRRDLEERKRLEAALIESKKMEAIGRLAGGIAHDFNNMLTVIGASTSLAGSKLKKGRDPTAELAAIDEAAQRAASLTAQLLAYARSQPISPTAFDLNTLLADMAEMLHRLVRDDVRVHVDSSPDPVVVMADQGQISQVVMNLVVNACDAMPNGGHIEIRTRLDAEQADEPRDGLLWVKDDGEGLEPEVKERIFEPFFTTKAPGVGTGLGLSSSYGIVARAGGRIEVESEAGAGTSFCIRLPGARPSEVVEAPTMDQTSMHGDEHIVLVDDEPALARLAAQALRNHGYRVHAVESGELALSYLSELADPPDLLITDVVMPEMDGPEVARRARALYPGLPTLFITGYGEHNLTPLEPDQPPEVLRKPFRPDQLTREVRRILDSGLARGHTP